VYLLLAILGMVTLDRHLPGPRWSSPPAEFAGVALIATGVTVILTTAAQFRKHKTTIMPFQPSSTLITQGLFRFSRNPIYLGMIVILFGVWLTLSSTTPATIIPLFAWFITKHFIVKEERTLTERFADEYREYRQRVRRWL
jgi:protein-S-isoprenylcysteine O-methyltransferase Ste14